MSAWAANNGILLRHLALSYISLWLAGPISLRHVKNMPMLAAAAAWHFNAASCRSKPNHAIVPGDKRRAPIFSNIDALARIRISPGAALSRLMAWLAGGTIAGTIMWPKVLLTIGRNMAKRQHLHEKIKKRRRNCGFVGCTAPVAAAYHLAAAALGRLARRALMKPRCRNAAPWQLP